MSLPLQDRVIYVGQTVELTFDCSQIASENDNVELVSVEVEPEASALQAKVLEHSDLEARISITGVLAEEAAKVRVYLQTKMSRAFELCFRYRTLAMPAAQTIRMALNAGAREGYKLDYSDRLLDGEQLLIAGSTDSDPGIYHVAKVLNDTTLLLFVGVPRTETTPRSFVITINAYTSMGRSIADVIEVSVGDCSG